VVIGIKNSCFSTKIKDLTPDGAEKIILGKMMK
jgi:hypothetical protein